MRVFLAWHNTFYNKKRTLAAIAGITFSILLMFMEIGFLDTIRRAASLIYNNMDFDLIMVSHDYEYMNESGRFARGHLVQAGVTPGVDKIMPMDMAIGQWEDIDTEIQSSLMILGMEEDPAFVKNLWIRDNLPFISQTRSVMLDTLSHPVYGPLVKGREAKVNGVDVKTTSLFSLGMGFYADGAVIVSNQTFAALSRGDGSKIKYGLIKAEIGEDLSALKTRLRSDSSSHVKIFERQEMIHMEEDYFVTVMPIGIMVSTGVFISFLVGAVILFQVLSTEITNRLTEFATLKAAGFTPGYIYGTGFQQAVLFAALSYLPALVLTCLLFQIIHRFTRLPILMTLDLAGTVFVLSFLMCLISGFLALRKVKKADPAELFHK